MNPEHILVYSSAMTSIITAITLLTFTLRDRANPRSNVSRLNRHLQLTRLDTALNEAAELNSYRPGKSGIAQTFLQPIYRYKPEHYETAIREISQRYTRGLTVSIDLSLMDQEEAVRLVDFCSGVSAVSSGWMLRVADQVIVLTPSG